MSLILASLLLTLPAPQSPDSTGPLVAAPLTLSTSASSVHMDKTTVYHKEAGFYQSVPARLNKARTGGIDFAKSAVFANKCFDVDAMSMGYDWVNADQDGLESTAANFWMAIVFSVRTNNEQIANIIGQEAKKPDGAIGDAFTHLLPGGNHPFYPAGLYRGLNSTEINIAYFDGSGNKSIGNANAFDMTIAALELDLPARIKPTLYRLTFSVTKDTLGLVPGTWWKTSDNTVVAASGASLLATTWTGSSWTEPRVLYTHAELGLSKDDDIDALAFDWQQERLLFSTAGGTMEQIRVAILDDKVGNVYRVMPFKDASSGQAFYGPVSKGRPGIDAMCTIDPESPIVRWMIGTGKPGVTPVFPNLRSTVYRRPNTPSDNIECQCWGSAVGVPHTLCLVMTVCDYAGNVIAPAMVLHTVSRPANSAALVSHSFAAPVLNSADLVAEFVWVVKSGTMPLGFSPTMQIDVDRAPPPVPPAPTQPN